MKTNPLEKGFFILVFTKDLWRGNNLHVFGVSEPFLEAVELIFSSVCKCS